MKIDLEKIKKLPADVRKDFMKMYLQLGEKKKEDKVKSDFLSFVKHIWPDFIEGTTIKLLQKNLMILLMVRLKDL